VITVKELKKPNCHEIEPNPSKYTVTHEGGNPSFWDKFILFVCLFVLSRTNNFSAIWRLSPLPVTGLQI
jgi:hypothetical protein